MDYATTLLSEKIEPKLLVQVLNEFFKCSERIISKYKGFIDKFIGDAIMVEFGAPLYSENHRERAINCAIELRNAVENISHKIKVLGVDWSLEIRIGINSGEAILGIVGAENRIGYTALGDTVNVASRLEKLTRELKKDIIIGKSVYIDKFKDLTEGPISVKLKGKSKEMVVYPLKKNLLAPISDSILL
ncbi:MAG: adenylate/guanylate cyclase domain-containing protein [Planctomycetes bacterium]|nr:adenylate/guanylate cyclase domain-containing protein [Planctomycetota bacterium]